MMASLIAAGGVVSACDASQPADDAPSADATSDQKSPGSALSGDAATYIGTWSPNSLSFWRLVVIKRDGSYLANRCVDMQLCTFKDKMGSVWEHGVIQVDPPDLPQEPPELAEQVQGWPSGTVWIKGSDAANLAYEEMFPIRVSRSSGHTPRDPGPMGDLMDEMDLVVPDGVTVRSMDREVPSWCFTDGDCVLQNAPSSSCSDHHCGK
jgi:hypothetical protein